MSALSSHRSQNAMQTRVSLLERALAEKDEPAWEELHRLYEPFVSQILGAMGFTGAELDDARQQVFFRLWQNLRQYTRDTDRATFRTWFARLIRNTALNIFRSKKREPSGPSFDDKASGQELFLADDPDIEARIEQEWQEYIVELAFERARSKFSGHAVEVFRLSLDGNDAEDIARKLNIRINTVYILKHRVKTVLINEIQLLTRDLEPSEQPPES